MNTRNNDICEIKEDNQEIEYLKPMFRYFDSDSYKIVSNKCCKTVQSEVSSLMHSGWELYERLVVTCCNDYVVYTQALIKTAIVH
jgi:hypothetical protein